MMSNSNYQCIHCGRIYDSYHNCAKTVLDNIQNLVFQGGGVKGIAYIGALKELEKRSPGILSNVQRVAGSSAGAMLALYLGLKLDVKEIQNLLGKNYINFLDDGYTLQVITNPYGLFWSDNYLYFNAKDIFIKALSLYKKIRDWAEFIKVHIDIRKKWIMEELKPLASHILYYWAYKTNTDIMTWFFTKLGLEDVLESHILPIFFTQKGDSTPRSDADQENLSFTDLIDKLLSAIESQPELHYLLFSKEKPTINPPTNPEISSKDQLTSDVFYYALGELLWVSLRAKINNNGQNQSFGLFNGSKVKRDLIEGAIQKKFALLGRSKEYKANMTFRHLASFRDLYGKPLFRPFYLTAYNTATLRTEVFSIKHSPDVVVADAVRASISIPIFFTSVPVRENGAAKRIYPNQENPYESKIIYYMDGGILDNYPVRMFDDAKYYVNDELKWTPVPKNSIGINPETLGFRILHKQTIDAHTKLYYNFDPTKVNKVANSDVSNKNNLIIKILLNAIRSSKGENPNFIRKNYQRSVYIDDCGYSPISFDFTEKDQMMLIQAGSDAIANYIARLNEPFK